eukprot:gene24830-30004_t
MFLRRPSSLTTRENQSHTMDRHCDKCNLEVPRGTVLTTLCVDGLAHHLVDNVVPVPAQAGTADTSGHVSVTGTISPLLTNAITVTTTAAASANLITSTLKPSTYYLKLFARVLKDRRTDYHLVADAVVQKATLRKRNGPAIIWLPIDNPVTVRDFYICFRLCGDDVLTFVRHFCSATHEDLNEGLDGTPPVEVLYAPKYM